MRYTPTSKTRLRWQVFRRVAKRGLVRVDVSQGDRVKSKVLRAWLRAVGSDSGVRIRIAEGENGEDLFPTEAEAERAAREAAEAARDAAEAEVARLRLVIERAKRSGR